VRLFLSEVLVREDVDSATGRFRTKKSPKFRPKIAQSCALLNTALYKPNFSTYITKYFGYFDKSSSNLVLVGVKFWQFFDKISPKRRNIYKCGHTGRGRRMNFSAVTSHMRRCRLSPTQRTRAL
jgi:hypothetical protein